MRPLHILQLIVCHGWGVSTRPGDDLVSTGQRPSGRTGARPRPREVAQ